MTFNGMLCVSFHPRRGLVDGHQRRGKSNSHAYRRTQPREHSRIWDILAPSTVYPFALSNKGKNQMPLFVPLRRASCQRWTSTPRSGHSYSIGHIRQHVHVAAFVARCNLRNHWASFARVAPLRIQAITICLYNMRQFATFHTDFVNKSRVCQLCTSKP